MADAAKCVSQRDRQRAGPTKVVIFGLQTLDFPDEEFTHKRPADRVSEGNPGYEINSHHNDKDTQVSYFLLVDKIDNSDHPTSNRKCFGVLVVVGKDIVHEHLSSPDDKVL